jgi:hypothetical protein
MNNEIKKGERLFTLHFMYSYVHVFICSCIHPFFFINASIASATVSISLYEL